MIDYSQPIVTTGAIPDPSSPTAADALSKSDQARDAFYKGDYTRALADVDSALAKTPSDAVLHEFRALVLFAAHKYTDAAATLYAVLSVGPGWDWTTMCSLYPSVDVYSDQLRALEHFVKQNPDSPDGRFLLAYHYMTAGHTEAAVEQLERVVRLVPNDRVSRQLLALIAPAENGSENAARENASRAQDLPSRTPPGGLIGRWNAPSSGGGKVELSLAEDNSFTWRFTGPGKSQAFDGKYDLAGTTLVLEYSNGGTMVGKVSAEGQDRFSFKMVGGPPNDSGLTFSK